MNACEQGPDVQSECGLKPVYSIRIIRADGWAGLRLLKCVPCAAAMMNRFATDTTRRVELTLLEVN